MKKRKKPKPKKPKLQRLRHTRTGQPVSFKVWLESEIEFQLDKDSC